MEDRDRNQEISLRFLRRVGRGEDNCTEIEVRCLKGLKDIKCPVNGLIRCSYIVSNQASDKEGKWDLGAMTTLIDVLAGAAMISLTGQHVVSTDLSVSYFSTPTIHEEVEVEAKVVGHKGMLPLAIVEVRRKADKGLIAVAKLWAAPTKIDMEKASKL
ncbi:Thioesterase domain [Dillenia turbinata]|uniref:Thioesterase domain n=1 Tax=Dillenia turbinata TaxID=194707 RepID=A0AAN8YTH8_9MAGN